MTAAGGSLRALCVVFALALAGLLALRARIGPGRPADLAPRAAAAGPDWPARAGAALCAAGALLLAQRPLAFWWFALAAWALAYAGCARGGPARAEPPLRNQGLELGLWGLAVACVLLTLVSHRFDADDCFYVNVAAAAADAPGAPLLAGDTLLGIPGLPLHLSVYRLESYELAIGALAWLSGTSAIAGFHWAAASLAALAVPLAHARLLRWLTPRHWLPVVVALVVVLVAAGDTHRWYGNFAFVRLWQGKSILLFVFLPLVQAYALEFGLRPSARGLARLAGAQVAALGSSSTALWAAPACALAAAAAVVAPSRRGFARLALVLLASGYVLAAGLAVARSAQRDLPQRAAPAEQAAAPRGAALGEALDLVLGTGPLRRVALAALLASWGLCAPGLGRRYAIAVPLAVAVVLLDPYAAGWIAGLTGSTYWRTLWALPLPLLLAVALASPLWLAGGRGGLRWAAAAAALGAFAAAAPSVRGLSEANGVRLGAPRLKVDPVPYGWAAELTRLAGPGAIAIAPASVSVWLPTLRGRVFPLVARPLYLERVPGRLSDADIAERLALTLYVGGEFDEPGTAARLARGLARYRVGAVCLRSFAGAERAREALRAMGFGRAEGDAEYELWLRVSAPRAQSLPILPGVSPPRRRAGTPPGGA